MEEEILEIGKLYGFELRLEIKTNNKEIVEEVTIYHQKDWIGCIKYFPERQEEFLKDVDFAVYQYSEKLKHFNDIIKTNKPISFLPRE